MENKPNNVERRGDGFDIGEVVEGEVIEPGGSDIVSIDELMQNPAQLLESLKMTPKQTQNVNTILFGGGATILYNFLAPKIGERLAGIVSGGAVGFINSKLFGSREQK